MVSSAAQTLRWNGVPTQLEFEVELGTLAGEVRLELLDGVGERRVVSLPAVVARLIGLIDHPQMHQAPAASGKGERPDRAVDGTKLHG